MIGVAFLLGAVILGASLISKYWKGIKNWIERAVSKVKSIVSGLVLGVRVFVKKAKEAFQEISKHYSQDRQGQWEETTVTKKVSPCDVPSDILDQAVYNQETDVTDEMQEQLSA